MLKQAQRGKAPCLGSYNSSAAELGAQVGGDGDVNRKGCLGEGILTFYSLLPSLLGSHQPRLGRVHISEQCLLQMGK